MSVAKKKNQKNRKKNRLSLNLPSGTNRWILGLLMFLIAIIIGLSFFDLAGAFGRLSLSGFSFLIGNARFGLPLIFVLAGLVVLSTKYNNFFWPVILAVLICVLALCGILGSLEPDQRKAGWIGYLISWPLLSAFGFWVAEIIFITIAAVSLIIFWHLLPGSRAKDRDKEPSLVARTIRKMRTPKFKVSEVPVFSGQEQENLTPADEKKEAESAKERPAQARMSISWQAPPLNMLQSEKGRPNSGDVRANSSVIKKTLHNFGIEVVMSEINVGPTVTQYTLKPAEGVKLSKITGLTNNLSLALASHPIRIEAPIPGRSLVGVEVPNKRRAFVRLRDLLENSQFQAIDSSLVIALGKDVAGKPIFTNISGMPHLLVAGATGTGKTIFLNSLILSLLYQRPNGHNPFGASPEILRFILIDPKRVEFTVYNNLPHLLCPVIYNAVRTVNVLKWLVAEMERRFEALSENRARDIASYNSKILKNQKEENKAKQESLEVMPYIVLIIDELADLMAAKGREIEAGIVRLAQMARAVGIHLVVATQRPSVEVITGLIKANITSRITFQVASQVDSRTVLDMAGAERLLGMGDMLYISADNVKPKRIQGAFVSDKEVKSTTDFIKSKTGVFTEKEARPADKDLEAALSGELSGLAGAGPGVDFADKQEQDPLYQEAKRLVIEARKASASYLQRMLRIGYARAARLLDSLQDRGVVGPQDGAKPREVYLSPPKHEPDADIEEPGEQEWKKI